MAYMRKESSSKGATPEASLFWVEAENGPRIRSLKAPLRGLKYLLKLGYLEVGFGSHPIMDAPSPTILSRKVM